MSWSREEDKKFARIASEAREISATCRASKIVEMLKELEILDKDFKNSEAKCQVISDMFARIMDDLPYKQAMVLHLRHLWARKMTYSDIADILGIGRQRASHIYNTARRRLKHPARVKAIKTLMYRAGGTMPVKIYDIIICLKCAEQQYQPQGAYEACINCGIKLDEKNYKLIEKG